MTSGDNSVDMAKLELLLREHFARTDKQLSDMRAENAEFRSTMLKEFNALTERIDRRISAFEGKVDEKFDTVDEKFNKVDAKFDKIDARFDRLEAKVEVLQNDITGLKHDVNNLYTWNYWALSIIIALLAMPQIVAGVKALLGALTDTVSAVARAFRKEDQTR